MNQTANLSLNLAKVFHRDTQVRFYAVAKLDGLELRDSGLDSQVLDGRLSLKLVMEQTGFEGRSPSAGAVLVRGKVAGVYAVRCRRCLEPTRGDLTFEVDELFEAQPKEGETWPIMDDSINLAPMLREAALLALPLAPLCGQSCRGPAPERFPTGNAQEGQSVVDSRWAALSQLKFEA